MVGWVFKNIYLYKSAYLIFSQNQVKDLVQLHKIQLTLYKITKFFFKWGKRKPTHTGVIQRSNYVTPVQQQRPELPMVTLNVPVVEFMYLWWSLCTLYLHACQVRVTVGDLGLCCCACVTYFEY